MLLLKFNAIEFRNVDTFLGPFTFSLFIFFVIFICSPMFMVMTNKCLLPKSNRRKGLMDK
jgi:hypothetical protein